jgi:hypothetical protein
LKHKISDNIKGFGNKDLANQLLKRKIKRLSATVYIKGFSGTMTTKTENIKTWQISYKIEIDYKIARNNNSIYYTALRLSAPCLTNVRS